MRAGQMITATLVAPRAERELAPGLVAEVAGPWGGGEVRWLSRHEAAEFDMAGEPADLWEVWAMLQDQGIDLLVQNAAGRRKRLLLADMDSTMIRQECIDELAAEAGVGEAVAAVTARAMNGEIDFEAALRARVATLKGLPIAAIDRVLETRITTMPGGHELVATMRANGARAVLVSGGFTAFATRVGAALGFDEARANVLLTDGDALSGEVAEPILGREAKAETLRRVVGEMGIAPEDVLAVGDGANDLGMLRLAGSGVALHAKPIVAAECRLRVTHGDLSALLFLQGYRRDEFVT
jgi:phosphoserine phosphatase